MIKITITSIMVDSYFVELNTDFEVGDTAYYVVRENGKRLSDYYFYEHDAVLNAWELVVKYGLTLVEPW
mgnify:CR=1 FL=1